MSSNLVHIRNKINWITFEPLLFFVKFDSWEMRIWIMDIFPQKKKKKKLYIYMDISIRNIRK